MTDKKSKNEIAPVPKADLLDSRWINTPFAYTRLGANFSLLQQEILLKVSDELQPYVHGFLDAKGYERKDRPNPLFTETIPTIRIPLTELSIGDNHYMRLEDIKNEILGLNIMAADVDKDNKPVMKWMPVFDEVSLPMYAYSDQTGAITTTERKMGYMDFSINPKVASFVFDMQEGYVNHLKLIAPYSRRQSTPRIYLFLRKAFTNDSKRGSKQTVTVLSTVREVKDYTGVIEHIHLVDEEGKPYEELKDKYPKFSRFCKEVLDKSREDLLRMAALNQTDIIFDYTPIYKGDRRRGDPDYIEFRIKLTNLGKNRDIKLHREAAEIKLIKDLMKRCPDLVNDELRALMKRIDTDDMVEFQNYAYREVWQILETVQPDDVAAYLMQMFRSWVGMREHKEEPGYKQPPIQTELFTAEEQAETIDTADIRMGEGMDLWKQLLKNYNGSARELIGDMKYLGLYDGVFYLEATREQRMAMDAMSSPVRNELYQQARLLLGMSVTSYRTPIVLK